MLKRVLIFVVVSPFLAGSYALGLLFSNWGASGCQDLKLKAVTACEQRHETNCEQNGSSAYQTCFDSHGFAHRLGTTFTIGSLFIVTGLIVGFRNLLAFTGISFVTMSAVAMFSEGARRR